MHSSRSPGRHPHRLILLVAAVVTLVTSLSVIPAATAADTLLSQGRPVTASSAENVAFPATAAVDGDPGTRWSSAFSDPQWIQVDLGEVATVTQVVLNWETAYGKAFQIQTSRNGADWTPIHSTTTGAGGTQTLTVSGSGRYVRMYGTQRATQYGYSLWELQIYGTLGGGPDPTPTPTPTVPGGDRLLSYGRTGAASSSQSDQNCWECTPARAFDRDPASRWATSSTTGWVDPGWIYVDLGATAQITKVVLQWDPAYARAFQIQVSPDASAWTPIYSTTAGTGFKQTLTVSGSGRYVRMYGTQRATPYGYSLWEFQVYGTGGAPITPPPLPPDPAGPPRLVWSDEFNGAAGTRPDAAKWTADPGTGPNNELEYYTNHDNAAMDGAGSLVLEARKQVTAGSTCPRDPLSGSGTCQYTSARMNTGGKFEFTYGRVEARVKVPKGNGLWPAFWMMGADFRTGRPWPYNGEIDILEVLGKDVKTAYSTVHAPAYNGGGGVGGSYRLPGDADFSDDFHVWAANWDSKGIVYTLDGRTVFTIDKAAVEATRGPWVFDHPFYIILNLAVGGDWPGPPDATTPFPRKMLVDYVRVYQ
ncbi:discoidin domain-containing protein [Streptosporangium roseum]|uniref:Licheninase n=1 Tax=Streptosporangium roseum (strain ATCC 12428 / DSM 43021 / JCM 3005 / KCTC 9067 / NCIMB 10171 / NRRL 2505 / NI 9100) TaxID=479432 RepID=D2BEX1_STRRD|nr:discoidin domain-containing protein [Streptosporangium roseum]ACZ86332.1 Licheninase [Streptosporangium roseum DSM 43021]